MGRGAGRGAQGELSADPRIGYLLQQIANSFKAITPENFGKFRDDAAAQDLLLAFANGDDGAPSALFVAEQRGLIKLTTIPPAPSKAKDAQGFLYVLKLEERQPLSENCAKQVVIGECGAGVLEHAEQVAATVFAPLLAATKGEASELVVREVDEGLSSFVANVQIMRGHAKGTTALPLPPDWAVTSQKAGAPPGASRGTIAVHAAPSEVGQAVADAKDAIHALESAIITWTKQIRAVLKEDPETTLATEKCPHPGPVAELDFWTAKSKNLNSIFDQLQSVRVRKVLRCLDRAQSTYNAPFAKLCKELFHARTEANDNVKFLGPLREWVEKLEESTEFSSLPELYAPVVHTILLIWKGSGHYNRPTRLVVLVREICNALVRQATDYLAGLGVFELIGSEDARDAVAALRETLRVLAAFKEVYLRYKDRAAAECPLNAWRVQNNAVFVRLDAFWERCHDVLELTQTTMQFGNLAKIEVGGTKGKILTTSVLQIHADFSAAVHAVRKHGDERLLDTDAKEFDDAFYEFRVSVKELERRLASVLTQGFDDAPTLAGRFKLLDSFDALTQRAVVAEELERKYAELVAAFGEDVKTMQKLFVASKADPPISHNLPPIAGALTWCRGLLQRVRTPMEKLKRLEKKVMEREEARDVVKDYTAFQGQLSDFEREQIEAWGGSVERSSQAKLKNPLLRLETPPDGEYPLLYVNFDPLLVRLLREVKYFLLLGFEAPGAALEIYQHAEVFRRHMGNLDLIVNVYNWMQTTLLPVERPLLKAQLDKVDKLLAQGIGRPTGEKRKEGERRKTVADTKKALNWKSNNIDLYITECMTEANAIRDTVVVMKANLHRVEEILETWSVSPLLKRSGKAATVDDFEQLQKLTLKDRYQHVKDGAGEVHKLVKDTNRRLKVSQGLPDWKAYVDFVNNIVVGGLKRVVLKSLGALEEQLDPVHLAKPTSLGPMLEIELDLVGGDVSFIPEVGYAAAGRVEREKRGLRNLFRDWTQNFDHVATLFKRLDTNEGSYLRELQEDPELTWYVSTIEGRLAATTQRCEKLRRHFLRYEYLWTTDLPSMFADFLETAVKEPEVAKERDEDGQTDDEGTTSAEMGETLDLELFEEKIKLYLEVQADVAELKPLHEVDFLRVVAQPVKQALGTWVTKWMFVFTNFLQDRLFKSLEELHSFMSEIDRGLDQIVEEGDKDTLMSVMTHIRDVRKRMPTMEATFSPLRDTVALLKANNIALDLGQVGGDEALDFLERAPLAWDNTVNKTFRVKESIQPLQNAMVDVVKGDINAFLAKAKGAHTSFRRADGPFTWRAAKIKDAYKALDAANRDLEAMEAEAEAFTNLQELFELNRVRAPQLADMRMELGLLKQIWDTVAVVESLFASWADTLWLDITPDDLVDEAKKLATQIKKLPRRLRDWPSYLQLQASVANMAAVLPLVSELRSPAMRDRHWKAVAAVTRKPVNKGPTFCLKDLLALELHRHVEGIMEVVETAQKENKVEVKLGAIEKSWADAEFDLDRHRDTDVMVIVAPDDLLETLDEHHIQLQSMAAMGRAVDFFRAELQKWQKTLGTIESVMKALLTVGRAWASLEAIFLGSQDIRAQLPDDTKRFEGIDAEFKELMASVFAMKGVVACCEVEGREAQLVNMHKELEKCQKALTEYLDMKKNIFPRFYFVSNMALLDILSNSNNPTKIMPHIGAVFDGIDRLAFVEPPPLAEQGSIDDETTASSAKKIDRGPLEAHAMIAKDGEDVPFEETPFAMAGAVEVWLNELVTFMRDTLRLSLDASLQDASMWDTERPREEWVASYPAQIALITSQIVWTEETETALDDLENGTDDAVKKYLDVCRGRLDALIKQVQGPLEKGLRNKIITLITIDVHSRDIVQALITKRVESAQDFLWSSQLRYYWKSDTRDAEIRICDYRSVYSFEYVGNCGRLVITPLTDRCYVTLTTAIRLFLGGAPAGPAGTVGRAVILALARFFRRTDGSRVQKRHRTTALVRRPNERSTQNSKRRGPFGLRFLQRWPVGVALVLTSYERAQTRAIPNKPAGTGKTETTKDLSRGLGLPCYVFNCSDQMNYQTMADIFRGLSQSGAWGCFDEFNRIPIEVLSVVATQVKTVLDATIRFSDPERRTPEFSRLPAGTPPCKVGDYDFFGDKISLVPTCGFYITMNPGYAGRTELPENLKALFRSCAMIRPDLKPICENMLMAEGFIKARPLAAKFVTLYQLSSDLLSKQAHYDWGLRAVKSVLRVAGKLKRAEPEVNEEAILMRALRDFNTPKIPAIDIPIFLRLIADLFPGLELPTKVNEDLKQTAIDVAQREGLQAEDVFVAKVVQFQELLDVRHSVMLLGPPGAGKSTIYKTLVNCHNKDQPKPICVYEAVNPKAVTSDELYGYMTLSKDWKDGCLSIVMRNMCKEWAPYSAHQSMKWVVLDGDIDAVWIESMNTVMDDNKVLTLVSNERIPLTPAMRMVFEIHSLKNATPATVSRAGILYVNELDVGWLPFAESWVARRTHDTEKAALPGLFDKYVPQLIEAMREKQVESLTPVMTISRVATLCHLMEGFLDQVAEVDKVAERIEKLFLYASIWAFGGVAAADKTIDSRRLFSETWRQTFKALKLPEGGLVFEYVVDPASGEISEWADRVPRYEPVGVVKFSSIVVPTADLVSLTTLTSQLVERGHPVMFVGSAGTGKTVLVRDFLRNLPDDAVSATINMNYYTDAQALQRQLEQPIEKRSGKSYGPPAGKRLVYFVDDLNMPFVEEYGTQTPIELLRMHADYGAWYDRHDLELRKQIVDCQFICAMNHKAGSFSVNARYQRHFAAFGCQSSSDADLSMIFQSVLDAHLADFAPAVQKVAKPVVNATLAVHREMAARFLPSAIKFHYNFNMRDLASVFEGLCSCASSHVRASLPFARLWMHEAERVYSDRLISETEISRCKEILVDVAKRCLDEDPEALFQEPNAWTTFATATVDDSNAYLPVKSMESLRKVLNEQLAEYNEINAIMNLVLFDQAMLHVVRVSRIIGFPQGNALLVGVGGSGKQSLARLASFICGNHVAQVAVTSTFGVNELKEELKELYRKAGVKPAEPITFILTDSQIVDERFLVFINDVLASGVIPDLFTRDEYDAIFGQLRNAAKAAGVADTSDSMMEFFIGRVRDNLHVVLCFSPIGEQFRVRARRFPALINCTAIDWFHPWPKDALVSVAEHFLGDVDLGTEDVAGNVAHHVAEVHASVGTVSQFYFETEKRHNYVTPTSFLELISFYKTLLADRRADMAAQIDRLATGLTTLKNTNEDVTSLKEDLKVKMVEVDEKKVACDEFLEKMGIQRSQAEAAQADANVQRGKADVAAQEARSIEERAAGDLALAKPALDAALDAVNCLDKASMTELKSFSKPPAGVDKVTAALLILIKGEKKNFTWENGKKMMAKVDAFKEQLESFRGEDIPEDIVKRVEPYLADPNFNYEKMRSKSGAAANLCNWVVNIITFNQVYKKVAPLMAELEEAKASKQAAENDLAVVETKLAKIDAALNKLQQQFLAATQEKAAVEKVAKACQDRLDLAERLTSGLASEYDRWSIEVDQLRVVAGTLVGDVLLAAAFTSYIGAFGADFRTKLVDEFWITDLKAREIPLTDGVEPMKLLTTESKTAEWMNEGLPADRISIENGAIITNCNRWPLIIDPQLQGVEWIKNHEEARFKSPEAPTGDDAAAPAPAEGLREEEDAEAAAPPPLSSIVQLQLGEKNWVFRVTEAIRNGSVVIIENLGESIDAVLDPVLSRSVVKKGRQMFLKFGGEDVEYDPNFRLYLQTRLANPHYKPEIAAQCTLINFIVTEGGLEEQLLAKVVSREQPALERQKNELVQAFNRYKIQLKALEDDLLHKLANAPADILSDIPLIEGLESTKATAGEIARAVVKGKETEVGINEAREVYRPVATEASCLYFMLLKLNRIEYAYQYSLASFTTFFKNGMERAVLSDEPKRRVDALLSSVRWTIFQWVARGLFERHRLVFLVQLCVGLLQQGLSETTEDGEGSTTGGPWAKISALSGYSPDGLAFLLRGPQKDDPGDAPAPWIAPQRWAMVAALAELPGFEKLPGDLEDSAPRFLEWFNAVTPETEKLPLDWRDLDRRPFRKLLVVRCLRPDRLTSALAHFVRTTLPSGANYADLDADSNSFGVLEQAFDDASPTVPIYFILSPGANVVADVDKLAERDGMKRGETYHNVSLGQGQDVVAQERLETAHRAGHWVILNNVHLMPRWLRKVEKLLDEFAATGSHENFRVFMSSDPSSSIPIGILDRSIKLTSDPPSGLKANIKQAFCTFNREDYEELEPRTRGILFALCYFHAVMLERRKFGAQGRNMHYPFSVGDLTSSATVLRNYMENAPTKVPWDDLRYLFGDIMYGGHIVNDFDRLVCAEYLNFFMRDDALDEMDMYPYPDVKLDYFHAPQTSVSHEKVLEHIEGQMEGDSPLAFGFHPNAEIGFRTDQSEQLCLSIMELSPSSGGGGGEGDAKQTVAEGLLQDILENHREAKFDIENVLSLLDEPGPYHTVFLQECELMNGLIDTMLSTLEELDLGFKGELTMGEGMEALQDALFLDRVPGVWAKVAYPSIRGLAAWLQDLRQRLDQLRDWCAAPTDIPTVTWVSGLFNPTSFLTAVMQTTAQAQSLELDKLRVATEVTKKMDPSEFSTPSRDGAYVHGLALEGARWSLNSTMLEPSAAGEMTCAMPVINCKAASVDKVESNVYECPCYKHLRRGPTYVFSAPLKTKAPPAKWVLAGTALIMDVATK